MTSEEHTPEEEEVSFDEETREFVINLDASNEYLNSALRQANKEADRRWENRNSRIGTISFENKVDAVIILLSQKDENPLLEVWFKKFELACSIAVGYRHGWVSALSDEGKLAIKGAFEEVARVLEVSEEELYNLSLGK